MRSYELTGQPLNFSDREFENWKEGFFHGITQSTRRETSKSPPIYLPVAIIEGLDGGLKEVEIIYVLLK